jgi:glycosyltransferase involved in cell wall biosynthesis
MIRGGLLADRIRVIPNFLEPDPGIGGDLREGVLYAGRLAREKGVTVLLEAARIAPGVVRVVGGGPLAPLVEQADAGGYVASLGVRTRSSVLDELRKTIALVLPSVWFEGFPLVLVEAFATGTPVIASRIGSLAELIEDNVTGLLVEPNDADDLADRIRWGTSHPDQMRRMGMSARQRYEDRFRGPAHLAALLEAYALVGAEDRSS